MYSRGGFVGFLKHCAGRAHKGVGFEQRGDTFFGLLGFGFVFLFWFKGAGDAWENKVHVNAAVLRALRL